MRNHQIQSPFKSESILMEAAGKLGLKKLRWSLRRAHCPVPNTALVLEVGAGGNPYPRANVMLDAMESTIERNEQSLIVDRPLVLGLCEELPFKDKAFDFVIASHVLEHTDNPQKFLTELMRVSKAGYIETPDGWFEKMCAFTYHRLEVSVDNNKLLIKKKKSWKPDEIAYLWDIKLANSHELAHFLRVNPDLNYMRYYWKDVIDFEVLNPEEDASWPYPQEAMNKSVDRAKISLFRDLYLSFRRWLFSQNSRNAAMKIFDLLRCPTCHSGSLINEQSIIKCSSCGSDYTVKNGVPHLYPKSVDGFNRDRLTNK